MASYLSWTARAAGEHPRYWMNDTNGPTVASIRTRVFGDYSTYYNSLKSYCSSRYNYTSSYFDAKEPEYVTAFAFCYLMEVPTAGTVYAYGRKAIDVALYLAGLTSTTGDTGRRRMAVMAIVYDWCYSHPYMSSTYKTTLKNRVADYIKLMKGMSGTEYLWGHDSGDNNWCLPSMICILNDGASSGSSDYLTTTWATWMDELMDGRDDGTGAGFNPVHRHFADTSGDVDGGTYKGAGQSGYIREQEVYYTRLFPAVSSGIGEDWWTDEAWYKAWMHWQLWHWRCDKTFHLQGDAQQLAHYDMFTQCHAMQVAQKEGDTSFGMACQWLVHEIQANSDLGYAIWGPYYLWYCMWYDKTLGDNLTEAPPPTIAGYGDDNQMRVFDKAGKIVFRDGWETTSSSVTVSIPKKFTGGHQHRDAGHFDLAALGVPLLTQHGHYGPSQTTTYKRASQISSPVDEGDPTGHRYSFYKRVITKNVIRIHDSDEDTENDYDSYHLSFSHTAHFGVYNEGTSVVDVNSVGDQLWPKNTGNDNAEPDDLNDIEGGAAESKWVFDSWPVTPSEESTYCYAVANLLPFYYSGKCTRYRRHFLWLKAGTVPDWARPMLLIWDDVTTHVDADATLGGKKTRVYQLQPLVSPTGTAADLTFSSGSVRLWHKMVSPASVETATITGYYDPSSIEFPPDETSSNDDDGTTSSKAFRVDIWPASAGSAPWNSKFVSLVAWGLSTDPSLPTVALIDAGGYVGVQFGGTGGLEAKFATGDTHTVVVAQDTPPAAPTSVSVTPYSTTRLDVNWADNTEEDFASYNLYWSKQAVDESWGDWSDAIDTSTTSSYSHTSLDPNTNYRYRITAVDDAAQESDYSAIVSARTLETPPSSGTGAGVAPWRPQRRFSKFQLGDL